MYIVKLRGNAWEGSFLEELGALYCGCLQICMFNLKHGSPHYFGFIACLAVRLRKTGDHGEGESMWAVQEE